MRLFLESSALGVDGVSSSTVISTGSGVGLEVSLHGIFSASSSVVDSVFSPLVMSMMLSVTPVGFCT
eukprot:1281098-Ditylum_brightwellii.AAC.1